MSQQIIFLHVLIILILIRTIAVSFLILGEIGKEAQALLHLQH